MHIELHDTTDLEVHLAQHGSLAGTVCQGLDLRQQTDRLAGVPVHGAFFLGCRFAPAGLQAVTEGGAVVFPDLPDLPYRPYRSRLYAASELMDGYVRGKDGSFYDDTADSAIYRHYQAHKNNGAPPIIEALAQRLHDHAIDDALHDFLRHHPKVVGIMGGHAMRRGAAPYRAVAQMGQLLTQRGYLVATGGGPGAMEAGNLGAWFAEASPDALDAAIDQLAEAPHYRDARYLDAAYAVRDQYPEGGTSLAIPTWFYGHEPTNLFASHVAKYFANSLREDGLLAIATHGVVYAPGSAGTIQEVFMDAAQNHYVTFEVVSPMVFFGTTYWTKTKPVYPLVQTLAADKPYADALALTDDPEEAVAFIEAHPPWVPA
ncbi:MAG: hypothetical protein AAF970_04595 [Bacteroidota bacterium]